MKPRSPTPQATADPGYPSHEDHSNNTTNRRDALLRIAAGLGAGAAALVGREAEARNRDPLRVTFRLSSRHHLPGCDYVVERLELQTPDPRLAAFLGDAREHAGLEKEVRAVLTAASCADVTHRKRLGALESRVAKAMAARYRARQRRQPAALIATLVLGRYRPPVPGGIAVPSRPVPRP